MAELREIYKDEQKVRQIAIAIFQMLDTQKQGFLSQESLDSVFKEMAAHLSTAAPTPHEIEKAFSVMDTDRDKKIYLQEFIVVVQDMIRLMAGL